MSAQTGRLTGCISHVAVVAEDEEGRERKRGRGGGTEEGSPSSSPLAALSLLWTRVLLSEDWKEGLFKTKAVYKVVVGKRVLYHVHITKDCVFVCGVGTAVQEYEREGGREDIERRRLGVWRPSSGGHS